jgi:hypothetical protein
MTSLAKMIAACALVALASSEASASYGMRISPRLRKFILAVAISPSG